MENPISDINDDWEIVPNSSPSSPSSPSGGVVIHSDHFSLDPVPSYAPATSTNDAAATPATDTDNISSGTEEGDDGDSCSSSVVGRNSTQGFCEIVGQFPKPGEIVQNSAGESEDGVVEDGEEKKRVVLVWWKVPMEVLKYCVVRVSPVWGVSMAAAALMGFVLLRRRYLYMINRKRTAAQLNVAVDNDKKVSQLLSRTARLNEAFSVVKRIPISIIRPALPAPGMTSWPVMSSR